MKTPWILCALAGCATVSSVPAVRFANAPIVSAVNDRIDVPNQPEKRLYMADVYFYDGTFERPITRALELHRTRRALGVNALDEVPDSTWFTNRIGVRELTPDEIHAGPVTDALEPKRPWTVRSTKIGGTTVGLIIKDARGIKYMIKFDAASDPPELETGTHVVVNRLLWACGYNVPEDQIVYFRTDELVLASDASVKNVEGDDVRRLERAELEHLLTTVRHEADGRIRTLASRWIDGKTIGGHPGEGVREDDPNDRIPHELRRDLRGQYPIYAWLDAVDVTEGQYVDTWLPDPGNPKRHYVKHYAIDFGKSLGAMGAIGFDWWRGHAYRVDFKDMFRSLATGGVRPRPWQDREGPTIRGVSTLFEAYTFEPGAWHPDSPGYAPFLTADRIDKFWGAKLVGRFTRAQIRAAVEAGRFSDPHAVDYITDVLVSRQRATTGYWFQRVNPLDQFEVAALPNGASLCFDDLAITEQLAPSSETRYTLTGYDFRGAAIGTPVGLAAERDGHTCTQPLAFASRDAGYTILEIATERPGFTGKTFVHVATDPSSATPRVIGVWRP